MTDLLPDECKSCAIYFDNCFDFEECRRRCTSKANGNLLVFAVSHLHRGKSSVDGSVVVESVPADSISIAEENAVNKDGASALKAGALVLRPYLGNFTSQNYWHKNVRMHIQPATEAVTAVIKIYFNVEHENIEHRSSKLSRVIRLDVNVPPGNESVEACTNELVQLNETTRPEIPEHPGQKPVLPTQFDQTAILEGLQRHLKNLAIKKGSYLANKASANGPIQRSEVDAQIAGVEGEIEETQRQIETILRKTG